MYVGVILKSRPQNRVCDRIPHVCGGDPRVWRINTQFNRYSPCMWG